MKHPLVTLKSIICFLMFLNPLFLICAETSFGEISSSEKSSGCQKHCKKNQKGCHRDCRGPRGKRGKQGNKGDRGNRGHRGKKGDRGHRGKKGDRGEQGRQGDIGEQGLPGLPGVNGTDCVCPDTFGAWFIPGTETIAVPINTKIPFVSTEAVNGIINNNGTFTLPNTGVYRCDIGIVSPTNAAGIVNFFDLILNPQTNPVILTGGEIVGSSTRDLGINPVMLMFSANAGDTVELRFAGFSNNAVLGFNAATGINPAQLNFAFISFLQIR